MVRVKSLEEKTKAIFIYLTAGRDFHKTDRIFYERLTVNSICRKYPRDLVFGEMVSTAKATSTYLGR